MYKSSNKRSCQSIELIVWWVVSMCYVFTDYLLFVYYSLGLKVFILKLGFCQEEDLSY